VEEVAAGNKGSLAYLTTMRFKQVTIVTMAGIMLRYNGSRADLRQALGRSYGQRQRSGDCKRSGICAEGLTFRQVGPALL